MKRRTKTRAVVADGAPKTQVMDGLVNVATGLGTMRSKRSHGHWRFEGLINDWTQYEAAYQSSWLAKNIINTVPADITREWREIKCDDADDIRIEEDRLGVINAMRSCYRWARLYGGAAILMLTDQPLDIPLNIEKIKKGGLKNLLVLDRFYLAAGNTQVIDVLKEDFMMPTEYYLAQGNLNAPIHPSHIIRMIGEPLPPRLMYANNGWGDSTLRVTLEPVEDLLSALGGVGESLQEFNVDVIKRDGMFADMTGDEAGAIQKRFEQFRLLKSVINLAILDGSEEFDRKNVQYSGIDTLIDKLMLMISGACHTPMTKLFGMSPGGLNATGDSDLRNYNDFLRSIQAEIFDPAMRKLDEVLVRSAIGRFPEDFNYEWKPLTTPSPTEVAQAAKTQADTDQIYLDSGVITISQIQRNLQAAEKYTFDEERIDELEKIEKEMPLNAQFDENDGEAVGSGDSDGSGNGVQGTAPRNSEADKRGVQKRAEDRNG